MEKAATKVISDNRVKLHIKGQLQLIEIYLWLIDSFLAEFFVCNLWSKIPSSWQSCLEKLSLDEFYKLIHEAPQEQKKYSLVLPLSLQAFIASCHHLALPREQLVKEAPDGTGSVPNGGHVKQNFRKHVKLKKQYEVKFLSQLIKDVGNKVNCFQTVDVGGGLGHLSRYLAFIHKFRVVTIESEGHHKIRAEQFDKEVISDLNKVKLKDICLAHDTEEYIPPVHITKLIPLDIKSDEFIHLLMMSKQDELISSDHYEKEQGISASLDDINRDNQKKSFILVGLHTCGDLSPTLLRTFVSCAEVKGIVLVGCCYMKLSVANKTTNNDEGHVDSMLPKSHPCSTSHTEHDLPNTNIVTPYSSGVSSRFPQPHHVTPDRDVVGSSSSCNAAIVDKSMELHGFPISHFIQSQDYPAIGWDALELACHNLDNYLVRLKDKKDKLKIQCYRSVLEVVIRKLKPDMKNPQIRCQKIKGAEKMTFLQYAEIALQRIHIPQPPLDLYKELNTDALVSRWKEVVMFYCLRLLLGPVMESLVLLDRYVYLTENGYSAKLCPVFDAKVSPRNFAVVSMKCNNN